jgi:hypothetical protein
MNRPTGTKPRTRLLILSSLIVPLTALQAAVTLKAARVVSVPLGSGWINAGLIVTALYVFLSPLVTEWLLRRSPKSRETLERRGTTADEFVLLVAVGTAGAGSLAPVILMLSGSHTGSFVMPWAAICLLQDALWCWRYRRVLL